MRGVFQIPSHGHGSSFLNIYSAMKCMNYARSASYPMAVGQSKSRQRIMFIFLRTCPKNRERIHLNARKKALNFAYSITFWSVLFDCGGHRAETIYFVDSFGRDHLPVPDDGLLQEKEQRLHR